MRWNRERVISNDELKSGVTQVSVKFAEDFGQYLADDNDTDRDLKPLSTSQLRKFFGEVKRQQLKGYNTTNFVMIKAKLAYAVGKAKQAVKAKTDDFYYVLADAIDKVEQAPDKERAFDNFILVLEAIVAYHKKNSKEK